MRGFCFRRTVSDFYGYDLDREPGVRNPVYSRPGGTADNRDMLSIGVSVSRQRSIQLGIELTTEDPGRRFDEFLFGVAPIGRKKK